MSISSINGAISGMTKIDSAPIGNRMLRGVKQAVLTTPKFNDIVDIRTTKYDPKINPRAAEEFKSRAAEEFKFVPRVKFQSTEPIIVPQLEIMPNTDMSSTEPSFGDGLIPGNEDMPIKVPQAGGSKSVEIPPQIFVADPTQKDDANNKFGIKEQIENQALKLLSQVAEKAYTGGMRFDPTSKFIPKHPIWHTLPIKGPEAPIDEVNPLIDPIIVKSDDNRNPLAQDIKPSADTSKIDERIKQAYFTPVHANIPEHDFPVSFPPVNLLS